MDVRNAELNAADNDAGTSGAHGGTPPAHGTSLENANLLPFSKMRWQSLLRGLGHRWKITLGIGTVVAVIAASGGGYFGKASYSKAEYMTYALLRLDPYCPFPGSLQRTDVGNLRDEAELVKARFILNAALARPEAAELKSVLNDPTKVVNALEENLKVTPIGSQILRITLVGSSHPADMRVLLNAVKDSYLDEVNEGSLASRKGRIDRLESIYADCKKALPDAQWGSKGPGYQSSSTTSQDLTDTERLPALRSDLFRLETDLRKSRLHLLALKQMAGAENDPGVATQEESELERDALLHEYSLEEIRLSKVLAQYESKVLEPERWAPYQKCRKEFDAVHQKLTDRHLELKRKHGIRTAQARATQVRQANVENTLLLEEQKNLRSQIEKLANGLNENDPPTTEVALQRLGAERVQEILRQTVAELEALRLEERHPRRVTSIQDAGEAIEQKAVAPDTVAAMAGLGGFCLVLASLAGWEFHARRIHTPDDLRAALGIQVLGALPAVPGPERAAIVMDAVATNARRSLSDAADRLRTRVLHELKSVNKPILLVTSAVPGEGKSTLAAELSRSMARGGLKTLLIDADFFRPAVHRHFKLPQAPGFSEVLRAEVSMPGPDQACTPGGVCVLPAGLVDERALAELSRGSFAAKIAEARAAFDVVIIDSSPVEAAVHPLVLGLSVDGVLISVLSRVSCVPPTQAAYRKLTDLGIHILGSVMSGVATSSRYNSYYYTPGHESEQHRMA